MKKEITVSQVEIASTIEDLSYVLGRALANDKEQEQAIWADIKELTADDYKGWDKWKTCKHGSLIKELIVHKLGLEVWTSIEEYYYNANQD